MQASDRTEAATRRPALSRRKRAAIYVATMIGTVALCFALSALPLSTDFWAKLFALFLLAGIPALSLLIVIRLRRRKAATPSRMRLYASLLFFECSLLAVPAIELALLQGFDLEQLGFYFPGAFAFVGWAAALILSALAVLWIVAALEARGWLPREPWELRLVPETRPERIVCLFLVAPVVGICEEIAYRGYLIGELPAWLPSHSVAWAVILSSLAFGLAHIQRGVSGVVRSTLIGALLACPVVYSGTIYSSMAAHAVYDALVLVWLAPWSIRRANAKHAADRG